MFLPRRVMTNSACVKRGRQNTSPDYANPLIRRRVEKTPSWTECLPRREDQQGKSRGTICEAKNHQCQKPDSCARSLSFDPGQDDVGKLELLRRRPQGIVFESIGNDHHQIRLQLQRIDQRFSQRRLTGRLNQ